MRQIFISYSSRDRAAADVICRFLEQQGISCWIAPRDVVAGQGFGGLIAQAIAAASAFVVILSRAANVSEHVANEIGVAFQNHRPIVPLQLERFKLQPELEYYLLRVHWIDAAPELNQAHLDKLLESLRPHLAPSSKYTGEEKEVAGDWRQVEESGRRGDKDSQYLLGCFHTDLTRENPDPSAGVGWFRKAADQGHAASAYRLALAYRDGTGLIRNESAFLLWIRKAAELGHAGAQTMWGLMTLTGQAGRKDPAEAARWFERAAGQGKVEAHYHLALLYFNGQGVPHDDMRAIDGFRLAAKSGNPAAQYHLAWMLAHGRGSTPNREEAREWARLAAAQGHEIARALYSELLSKIPQRG